MGNQSLRTISQLKTAWNKATKERPLKLAPSETDNFIAMLRSDSCGSNKNKFTIPKFYVNNSFEYISPLSGKLVTSRAQRKEEMKQHGVREVESCETRKRQELQKEQREQNERRN